MGDFSERLTHSDFPLLMLWQHPTVNDAIAAIAAAVVIISMMLVLVLITWMKKWRVLWHDWLTSTDHKRIGTMYIVLALVMLSRAVVESALMRYQQAVGLGGGFLSRGCKPKPDFFPRRVHSIDKICPYRVTETSCRP